MGNILKINLKPDYIIVKINLLVDSYSMMLPCTIEINFYNLNNFEFRKYLHGEEMILLTKIWRIHFTIYNMNQERDNIFKLILIKKEKLTIFLNAHI